MIKKLLFGIVWFVVLNFSAHFVVGAIAGAKAGANDPQNAVEAGRAAGIRAGQAYGRHILVGSALVALIGATAGILPGTRSDR